MGRQKKWKFPLFLFGLVLLAGFWSCGKLAFTSLPRALNVTMALPHTTRTHAACGLDLALELAAHPASGQTGREQDIRWFGRSPLWGLPGKQALLSFTVEHPGPQVPLCVPLS